MDHGHLGLEQPIGGLSNLDLGGRESTRRPVATWRKDFDALVDDLAVQDILGNAEMDDARSTDLALSKRAPREFGNALGGFRRFTPFAHRADHRRLIEILIGPATIRIDDPGPSPARNQQDAIALAVFDCHTREGIRRAGTIARDADPETPGQSRIGPRHVNGTRLMTWRHEPDSHVPQTGVEPEIAAVDDAEDDIDALGLKHAGDQCAPGNRSHPEALPDSNGRSLEDLDKKLKYFTL